MSQPNRSQINDEYATGRMGERISTIPPQFVSYGRHYGKTAKSPYSYRDSLRFMEEQRNQFGDLRKGDKFTEAEIARMGALRGVVVGGGKPNMITAPLTKDEFRALSSHTYIQPGFFWVAIPLTISIIALMVHLLTK